MTEVDVIVPVYGHWEMVERCIASLVAQRHPVRVIVVDDCSPDDTAARVSERFPQVHLVRQPRNSGFAAACNAGFRAGHADVVVLVNSDVEADEDLIGRLGSAFEDPDVASASPVILRTDGRLDAVGITADRTLAGFVRFHGASIRAADRADPELLGPYGAVAAYRRAAMRGGLLFDEGIFMYGEELDLALRLKALGYATAVVQDARATHLGGATTGKGSSRQSYLAGFARGYILRKYRVLQSRLAPRAITAELVVVALRLLRTRDTASLRGRVDGFRAGGKAPAHRPPISGLDGRIGFVRSLRMRSSGYWSGF